MSAPPLRRRRIDSIAAEAAFRARVAELGGQVLGVWVNARTPIDCVCANGHVRRPKPNSVQQGQGICRVCVGLDPAAAEAAFRVRVADLSGKVVGPYVDAVTGVDCVCVNGHPCRPRPASIQSGHGLCRACVGRCPDAAEARFRARVAELGGRVIGKYVGVGAPVDCVCAQEHPCRPWPNSVLRGQGLCRRCQGKSWDVFYVVTNPTAGRVKFGVTSNDERIRLAAHRRAGYTEVVRVHTDLPDADALERHIVGTLRDAGVPPVQCREYHDLSALPVILDVTDGRGS